MIVAQQQNGASAKKPLARNAIGNLTCENLDEGWVLVFRPSTTCLASPPLLECFRRLADNNASISAQHVFPLKEFIDDEMGGHYIVGRNRYIPIGQLLQEKPSIVTDDAWIQSFISSLIETLKTLHAKGTYMVDMNPTNVFVSKDAGHSLMLLPPCGPFCFRKTELWPHESEFLAPELLNDQEVDASTDIYAMTRLLQRLFKFSTTPPMYADLLKYGASPDKAKRPADMEAVEAMIRQSSHRSRFLRTAGTVAVLALLAGIISWSFMREEEPPSYDHFQMAKIDSLRAVEDTTYVTGFEEEVEAYLRDSSYLDEKDTAMTMSEEYKAQQKENYKKTIAVYKAQLTKIARTMLQSVYTPELMNGEEMDFRQQSTKAMMKIQEQQANLMRQYQLDPATAEAVAGEVIEAVTDELKQQARKRP